MNGGMKPKQSILAGITRANPNARPRTPQEVNPRHHSPMGVQNRVRVQVVGPDEHGNLVTKQDVSAVGNIMCTYGLSRIVALLAGGSMDCSSWIGGMRIGTDNTAAASTDSRLLASTGSIDLTDAGDVTEAGAQTLRCVGTFSSNNPAGAASIREIGIYASSAVTTGLVARKDLTGAQSVNKGASDSINVSYDIVFTTAA
jgi:hypothetical protein